MALSVLRPITVKAIVTAELQASLLADLSRALEQAERELQQLDFQGKKMLLDLERKHPDRLPGLQQQLEAERQKRQEMKQELLQRVATVEAFSLGQEVVHSTVQGFCTVMLGHRWSEVQSAEIVLRDDVVVEIRGLEV